MLVRQSYKRNLNGLGLSRQNKPHTSPTLKLVQFRFLFLPLCLLYYACFFLSARALQIIWLWSYKKIELNMEYRASCRDTQLRLNSTKHKSAKVTDKKLCSGAAHSTYILSLCVCNQVHGIRLWHFYEKRSSWNLAVDVWSSLISVRLHLWLNAKFEPLPEITSKLPFKSALKLY